MPILSLSIMICLAQVAAGLASVTDAEGVVVEWRNQLDALCVVTRQCSSAAVRCFLCEVYSCSGVVQARPSGELQPPRCYCYGCLQQRVELHVIGLRDTGGTRTALATYLFSTAMLVADYMQPSPCPPGQVMLHLPTSDQLAHITSPCPA